MTVIKKFLILVMLLVAGGVAAQDVLVLRDGTILNVKVLQVSDWEISYKKQDNPDGPVFSTAVEKVLSLKYENGTEQKFDAPKTLEAPVVYEQKANKGFSVRAGGAFPVGEFAETSGGMAKAGLTVGVRQTFAVAPTNLGLFVSADFVYNGMKNLEIFDELSAEGFDVNIPEYLNIPVLVGLNYSYKADEMLGLWAEFGIGVNYRFATKLEAKYSDQVYMVQKLDPAFSFAFQLGAGMTFNDKVSVGLNYYSMGSPMVKSTYEEQIFDEYDKYTSKSRLPIGVVMLRLGYHF